MGMKNILCYGDSNTWGFIPGGKGRYPKSVRWTGVAEKLLGNDYTIIEEGLNGRTSVFDSPFNPILNGKDHFMCSLSSHWPLDAVVIMLGTNDLVLNHSAWEASRGCLALVREAKNAASLFTNNHPKVLLMAPILVGERIKETDMSPLGEKGHEQSLLFAPLYEKAAQAYGVDFLDAGKYAYPDDADCEHMNEQGHAALGAAVAKKLKEMLG